MTLSFIIPAHNEAPLIAGTVRGVLAAAGAAGRPFEVIVVDDGSSDGTGEAAAAAGARVVRSEARQIAVARNTGAAAASGGVLVFVDADTRVTAAAVRGVVDAVERGAVGGGCEVEMDEPVPGWVRALAPVLRAAGRVLRWASGCFLFVTRDAFTAAGGFDPRLFASEEVALSRALKRRGRFVILRARVVTSGRKLRAYSFWEILRTSAGLIARGPRGVRRREGLAFWYARRPDPAAGGRHER